MKNYFILLPFFLLCFVPNLNAQVDYSENDSTETTKEKVDFKDRLYVTGNIALSFGTYTVLGANPAVGYKFTDTFSAGIGGTYMYYKTIGYEPESFYGGNLFAKQILFDVAFLQSEYHLMNVEAFRSGPDYDPGDRITIPLWYVGGGYRQSLGGSIYGSLKIMWDIIGHQESRFQNPYVTGGVSIGF